MDELPPYIEPPPIPSSQAETSARSFKSLGSLFVLGAKIIVPSLIASLIAIFFQSTSIAWLITLVALMAYSLLASIHVYKGRSFLLSSLVAVLVWLAMLLILGGLADANSNHEKGEGELAMILLLPMMGFPLVLGLVGCIRIVQWIASSGRSDENPPKG